MERSIVPPSRVFLYLRLFPTAQYYLLPIEAHVLAYLLPVILLIYAVKILRTTNE